MTAALRAAFPIDLHAHTTVSDGAWTPDRVIDAAARAGIEVLAITDHERGGDPALVGAASARGVDLVCGVELMTRWRSPDGPVKVDVLGLGVDWRAPALADYSERLERAQIAWTNAIVPRLPRVFGGAWSRQALLARADKPFLHEGDIYEELVRRGAPAVADGYQAYRRAYTAPGKPLYVAIEARLDPAAAIAFVHDLGGVAALTVSDLPDAHWAPLARALAPAGLDALEVDHPNLSAPRRERARALATAAGLLASGGSDFHAPERSRLGERGLSRAEAAPLLARLGR